MTPAWVGALAAAGAFTLSALVLLVKIVLVLAGTSTSQRSTAQLVDKLVARVARLEQRDRLTTIEARDHYRSEVQLQAKRERQ